MNIVSNSKKLAITAALTAACFVSAPSFAAENPMDHVGVEHNLYLDCLSLSKDRSMSPLQRVVEECGVDPGMSTDEFVKTYQAMIDTDPSLPIAKRMAPYRKSYSDYEFSFFSRIDQVVNTAKDAKDADAMFAKLEDEAVAKLDPKTHAGTAILGGLSVARHSLSYWSQIKDLKSNVTVGRWPRWIRSLVIVAADVAGAIIATEIGAGGAASAAGSAASDAVRNEIP